LCRRRENPGQRWACRHRIACSAQLQDRSGSSAGAGSDTDVPAIGLAQLLHHSQPQATAAGASAARSFQAVEWPEHRLALFQGDTRTAVQNLDRHPVGVTGTPDLDGRSSAIPDRVLQQIHDDALQGKRVDIDDPIATGRPLQVDTAPAELIHHLADELIHHHGPALSPFQAAAQLEELPQQGIDRNAAPGVSGTPYLPWIVSGLGVIVLGGGVVIGWKKHRQILAAAPALREEQKKTLIQQMAALDDAFESGEIASDDYHRQRNTLKLQLVALMSEEHDDGAADAMESIAETPKIHPEEDEGEE